MKRNGFIMANALIMASGGCALDDTPPVAAAESELSTLYSYHGRIEVHARTFGNGLEASFYGASSNCDRFGAFDFLRGTTGSQPEDPASARNACSGLALEKYSALNNPSDLNTCTSYTMGFQTFGCQEGFGANASRWTNHICDVAVTSTPRAHVAGTPAFVVRSIRYQVPGNRSSITYVAGDSNGSTWETTNSAGLSVEAQWAAIGTSGTLKLQQQNRKKLSLQRTSSQTENLTFDSDVADHHRDVISLWVNPKLDRYDACADQAETLLFGVTNQPWVNPAFDPTLPVMMDFTVGELLHPETVTDVHRSLFLAQLTQDDIRTRILALDPFVDQSTWSVVANPVLSSDRFRPVQGGTCPRNLTDPVTANRSITCQAGYSEALDTSETFNREWSVKTGFKIAGIGFGTGYSVSYSRTVTSSTGNNNRAEIRLATSTPGTCISGQLAVDTMFNVYIMSGFQFPCATLRADPGRQEQR